MLPLSTRTALLVALAAPVTVVAASCAQISGIDQYIDCPQDPACPTCTDGKKNGDESDVDCGGDCPSKCATGQACGKGADCTHGVCTSGKCEAPPAATCDDGLKNQDESDIDCGGVRCKKCTETQGCNSGADCESQVCGGGSCSAASCTDGKKNGGESDVDCGGASCEKCKPGEGCGGDGDCLGGACDTATMTCAASCTDMVKNGGESDVDCGGTSCPKCGEAKGCGVGGDCETGVCDGATGKCVTYFEWAQRFGDASDQTARALAVDSVGYAYMLGSVSGSIDFGGGGMTAAVVRTISAAKFDPTGAHVWSKLITPGQVNGAVVDVTGAVTFTGIAPSGANFGGGALTGVGTQNFFVAKLDTNGGHVWSKLFQYTKGEAIALTSTGQTVVLAETFATSSNFGCGALAGSGGSDVAIIKYLPSGSCVWSKRFVGPAGTNAYGTAITVDSGGDIFVGGNFTDSVDLGCGELTSAAGYTAFVAKLDSAGTCLWSRAYGDPGGGPSDVQVAALGGDGSGGVITAGYFGGALAVGGAAVQAVGTYNIWMARIDATGTVTWFKPLAGSASAYDRIDGAAFDGQGSFVITGSNAGSIDFGGGVIQGGGGFVAELDTSGKHLWSRGFAAGGWGIGYAPAHRVVVAGSFGGTLDLGGGPLISKGIGDIFLARFRLP